MGLIYRLHEGETRDSDEPSSFFFPVYTRASLELIVKPIKCLQKRTIEICNTRLRICLIGT
jgi:hypothetical protein